MTLFHVDEIAANFITNLILSPFSCVTATSADITLECLVLQSNGTAIRHNITLDDTFISTCNFNISRDTRIITHGWNSDTTSFIYATTPVEYAKLNSYNVIVVNWLKLSRTLYPVTVSFCLTKVAQRIIDFILFVKNYGTTLSSITLVGHSLGAHTSGLVGRTLLQMNSNDKIGNIIGLDPAGPLFGDFSQLINVISPQDISIARLNANDSDYVTCWHTNSYFAGTQYVNGCDSDILFDYGLFQLHCLLTIDLSCSHTAAVEYLTYSLNNQYCYVGYSNSNSSKIAYIAEPIQNMRENVQGQYEVSTSFVKPYCSLNQ